jgi:hypothetical protein
VRNVLLITFDEIWVPYFWKMLQYDKLTSLAGIAIKRCETSVTGSSKGFIINQHPGETLSPGHDLAIM